jgi:hypothetical protein
LLATMLGLSLWAMPELASDLTDDGLAGPLPPPALVLPPLGPLNRLVTMDHPCADCHRPPGEAAESARRRWRNAQWSLL